MYRNIEIRTEKERDRERETVIERECVRETRDREGEKESRIEIGRGTDTYRRSETEILK